MSGKDALGPIHIITNGAMTGTAVLTSTVVPLQFFDNAGVQAVWTGTPNGTFSFEVSNDYNANTGNTGTWTAYTITPTPAATGAAGDAFIDINQTGGAYCRVKYTNTSSTGTLNVFLMGKML